MTEPITMTISMRRKKRKREVINLTQLAASSGYSLSHMSRVFAGITSPSLKCLTALSECLDVTIDELLIRIEMRLYNIHYDHTKNGREDGR